MQIGIGITTTPNRDARVMINDVVKYSKFDSLYIHNDTEFKGVAYSKNMCLYNLKHCDYIFLFDDDCYPITEGWIEYLITTFKTSGQSHFLLLWDKLHTLKYYSNDIKYYKECGAPFMAFKKECVSEVGYMDSNYKGWGFEHAGYTNRIHRAKLNTYNYMMPAKLTEYLVSEDYLAPIKSSLTDEQKQLNYSHNWSIFNAECKADSVIYKPFQI